VRNADGFQVGIQAKLKFNIDVINQALERYGTWNVAGEGPDCRAVLVPDDASQLDRIAPISRSDSDQGAGAVSERIMGPTFTPDLRDRSGARTGMNGARGGGIRCRNMCPMSSPARRRRCS
jgi:hypothetical protein